MLWCFGAFLAALLAGIAWLIREARSVGREDDLRRRHFRDE